MVEMDKSQELYSKEGDNSCWFEGKTAAWEHTSDGKFLLQIQNLWAGYMFSKIVAQEVAILAKSS